MYLFCVVLCKKEKKGKKDELAKVSITLQVVYFINCIVLGFTRKLDGKQF